MAAVVSYSPPWWVNLLHRLPHFNFMFEQTSSDFQPEEWTYQQSILLLGGVALVCLALDLLFLLFYSIWLCCRRSKREEQPSADCCCTAWCVIIATLVCRVEWHLQVGDEILPRVAEFKHHGILFKREGRVDREINWWIGV
ncbi:protein tweety homolog 3-like [Entelurus aequoreus]|uniref:protein tweety homolog 3-like n=1 Tax=Entelurus aequoreus TaxID=161455 RepID=UPI002B1DDBDE|nr:protein tweety homolog 3-like [Entelurus aequoreus]